MVTETREGSPSLQLKQPATQILTALLLRQRRWDRPLGTAHTWPHFAHSQVSVDSAICYRPSHKICNSISEMNTAFQFALARSSGHSEACHQIKLVEPRVNAFGRFGTTECQIRNRFGFGKFQFQLLLRRFCLWLPCFEQGQPVCPQKDPNPIISCSWTS